MIREDFYTRHVGPRESEYAEMLKKVGAKSIDQFINQVVPPQIRQIANPPEQYVLRDLHSRRLEY